MKKSRSAGFGVIEIIIIVVVVALIGVLGYYLYTQQNKPAQNQTTTTEPTTKKDVTITEWGVKIALRDYDKVNFTVITEAGEAPFGAVFEAVATPSFKPQFLQNKDCAPGLALYRSKVSPVSGSASAEKKIGDYYYFVTGGPGPCSDDPNSADDKLKARFTSDFTLDNVSSL